jgi:hypothetical protein
MTQDLMGNNDYDIVEFDERSGQIVIECQGGQRFTIELPVEDGKYPEKDILDIYVRGFIPSWHIEKQGLISAGISNSNVIRALVRKRTPAEQIQDRLELSNQVIYRRNFLLQQSDWTQLSDNQLSEQLRSDWKLYRQSLRDINKQENFPDVKFEEPPKS